jgi:hypothetical protein
VGKSEILMTFVAAEEDPAHAIKACHADGDGPPGVSSGNIPGT